MNAHSQQYLDALIHQLHGPEGQYADLAVLYGSAALETQHAMSDVDVFYVPTDPSDLRLNRTVLINEIGYDLFGLGWDRLQRIADLEEDLQPLILQGQIIVAKDKDSRVRFEQLKARLIRNLKDPKLTRAASKRLYDRALRQAGQLVTQSNPRLAKVSALYALQDGLLALMMVHGKTLTNGFASLKSDCQAIPGFPMEVLSSIEELARLDQCEDLLDLVQKSLGRVSKALLASDPAPVPMTVDELTAFYQEAISTTHKIVYAHHHHDLGSAFLHSVHLQDELNRVFASTDLDPFDILKGFEASDWKTQLAHLAGCWDGFRADLKARGCDVEGVKDMETYLRITGLR